MDLMCHFKMSRIKFFGMSQFKLLVVFVCIQGLLGCNREESVEAAEGSTVSERPDSVSMYYKRFDDAYAHWSISAIATKNCPSLPTTTPVLPALTHPEHGALFEIPLTSEAQDCVQFYLNNNANTDEADQKIQIENLLAPENYLYEINTTVYQTPRTHIGHAAHWLDARHIAFPAFQPDKSYELWALDSKLSRTAENSARIYALQPMPDFDLTPWPHLSAYAVFSLPTLEISDIKEILKGDLWVVVRGENNEITLATGVQRPFVIDALYADAAVSKHLGAQAVDGRAQIQIFAPTARRVSLEWKTAKNAPINSTQMHLDADSGVWDWTTAALISGGFYRFIVEVFHPDTQLWETHTVTDPYSTGLSPDQNWSVFLDLENDPELQPQGWRTFKPKAIFHPGEHLVYETHVGDFSALDLACPLALRGTYAAFSTNACQGVTHLKALADAGMNTLHVLPTFNIASIPKVKTKRFSFFDAIDSICVLANQNDIGTPLCNAPAFESLLSKLNGYSKTDSSITQALTPLQHLDNYNWGYDPLHYGVPESSYATDADAKQVVREFRSFIMAVSNLGFKVVLDAVFNHATAMGTHTHSILDKIIPGYYHRLDPTQGTVLNSTCCANLALEHQMMEKLMLDMMTRWVQHYGVGGFRVDLMGHHPKANIEKAQTHLQTIRPDAWIFGEGWDFGEVAQNGRFINASQINMMGTGIGTFNDRLRDGVRGTRFGDQGERLVTRKGFANAWQDYDSAELQNIMHWVRLGMVGNLALYPLPTFDGPKLGQEIRYGAIQAGYAHAPWESITYVSNHDNLTLWDANQFKLPQGATPTQRARAQLVALAPVLFSQGVAYFHMGSEILRSKSGDRNSFNSSPWFNQVDFSGTDNRWPAGLPPFAENQYNYPQIKNLFANTQVTTTPEAIQEIRELFLKLLKIRDESRLFGHWSAEKIIERVRFLHTQAQEKPGLIIMEIVSDTEIPWLFLINPYPEAVSDFFVPQIRDVTYQLHPDLWSTPRSDAMQVRARHIHMPAQSVSVFIGQR